jgi:transposase InsO family protein
MSAEHSIAALCAALGVTPAGYHAWQRAEPCGRERTDAELAEQIAAVHRAHRGRYGAPRIQRELLARGKAHSRKRIARLLRERGLSAHRARRYVPRTTESDHDEPIAPNRIATRPAPTGRDQVWVSDLTCVPTAEGWLYAAVVLDRWSRRVIGWACASNLGAEGTALAALRMALRHRHPPRGLLHHSDRGVQYACAEHRALLDAAGIQPSMSRPGNPYDNAAMESWMATYKRECVALAEATGGYATRAAAKADFFDYVETYYNRVRRHSALGYQSPVDFENQLN